MARCCSYALLYYPLGAARARGRRRRRPLRGADARGQVPRQHVEGELVPQRQPLRALRARAVLKPSPLTRRWRSALRGSSYGTVCSFGKSCLFLGLRQKWCISRRSELSSPTQNLTSTRMDLLAWRFLRSHGVKAMAHWEASPFFTKDGQDVVKATGPHIVSEGWERVTAKETGGASSRGGMVASLAAPLGVVPVVGDGSSGSLPHWQKAFLLLIGGLVVFYIRRLLRSTRRPQRAAVSEVGARARTKGS